MPKYVIEHVIPGAGALSPGEYQAPDEASVRRHAAMGGFPANSIAQVRTIIDPSSAETA